MYMLIAATRRVHTAVNVALDSVVMDIIRATVCNYSQCINLL